MLPLADVHPVNAPALSAAVVRAMALGAGFDLCGFARAEPIPAEVLVEWVEAGHDAQMDWMGARTAERLDPRVLLPSAKTVVSLACNYYFPDPGPPSSIARYARGRDYHATLRDRLRLFRRQLDAEVPGLRSYGSVDAGPMMEKVWAARAGLGYVGRNGCLITEEFGSFVVLAALIIDREVTPLSAGPATDRCGGCSLCVTSCPTEAIVADATVDARRCLSYQTIENRSEIPEPLRAALAELTFGCDICQDVCPLNDAPLQAGPRFAPREVASLSVRDLAALTPAQYQALVPGSALARAKFDGLRRNAAYALGAARDAQSRPLLEQLREDSSASVREAAAWALARIAR